MHLISNTVESFKKAPKKIIWLLINPPKNCFKDLWGAAKTQRSSKHTSIHQSEYCAVEVRITVCLETNYEICDFLHHPASVC